MNAREQKRMAKSIADSMVEHCAELADSYTPSDMSGVYYYLQDQLVGKLFEKIHKMRNAAIKDTGTDLTP